VGVAAALVGTGVGVVAGWGQPDRDPGVGHSLSIGEQRGGETPWLVQRPFRQTLQGSARAAFSLISCCL